MTNKKIYEIADKLGMVEHNEYESIDEPKRTNAEIFEEDIATDLVATMNFVDELCLYNDLDTIKKFLVTVIYTNK